MGRLGQTIGTVIGSVLLVGIALQCAGPGDQQKKRLRTIAELKAEAVKLRAKNAELELALERLAESGWALTGLEGDEGAALTTGATTVTFTRCTAATLQGSRCKRKAEEDSDYCWQHEPLPTISATESAGGAGQVQPANQ